MVYMMVYTAGLRYLVFLLCFFCDLEFPNVFFLVFKPGLSPTLMIFSAMDTDLSYTNDHTRLYDPFRI